MYILGISCFYHDAAAALIKDGVVVAACDEERFSRKKHDASFPKRAIEFCLRKGGISANDLSYVVFYEKPTLKFERLFLTSLRFAPKSFGLFRESMKEWFFDKLWIKSKIVSTLNISPHKLLFSEHHLSHMASSFYASPFEKAALLSIDAVGEWVTTSWGIGEGNTIKIREEIHFPNSLGLLYTAFTVFCGYEANEGEYKLMGLAPYGKPKYRETIRKLLKTYADGSFCLNNQYFSYPYDIHGVYTREFEKLFGQKNTRPDEVISYYGDIAASIQSVFEEQVLQIGSYIAKKTGCTNLCYAGGAALNSKANWLLAQKTPFTDIFIQPNAGDGGGALGAALWAYHGLLGKKRTFVMRHAYYGFEESLSGIEQTLKQENIRHKRFLQEDRLVDFVSDALQKGKVVGWVQGRSEWGPRALGHRSILADPRSRKMKDIVNRKIKFREAFRPFAPTVLFEHTEDFFSVGSKLNQSPLQFMLYVVPVKKEKQTKLLAVTHVDGTARVQVLRESTNKRYYNLIKAFGQKTGTPVLLNTSFNLKGEPIVTTTHEALETFYKSGLDILIVGDYMIEKI